MSGQAKRPAARHHGHGASAKKRSPSRPRPRADRTQGAPSHHIATEPSGRGTSITARSRSPRGGRSLPSSSRRQKAPGPVRPARRPGSTRSEEAAPVRPRRIFDLAAVLRGASRGFSVLVLGEMLLRVVGPGGQQLGLPFAMLGAAGFVLAGHRGAMTTDRQIVLTGAAAAVTAFVLTMPLRAMLQDPLWAPSTAITVGFGAATGAAAGAVVRAHRRRGESTRPADGAEGAGG